MMYNLSLSDSVALRTVYSQLVSPGIYKNIQTGKTVGEEDDSQLMITLGFNNGGKLTGSLRYVNFNNKAYGILEPGQSKPGSADVYVEGCPQATSWFYNFDGDPTCSRLSAISTYAVSEGVNGVLTNYDPKFAHALAADESEDITRETLIANIKYDFGAFDANLIISDRTVTDDSVTDWARIDMDDYVPAPLIVDGDESNQETTELRLISKPGKFEWTIGYYNYKFNEEPNSVSQTQYAVDQDWLEYVMLYAAGLSPGDYDATIYCPPFCDAELSGSESDTRMKYAINYMVNNDLTLYATQAAGYRPGGNQAPLPPFCSSDEAAQANFSRRFNSDEAETTEFGVKARGENYSANVTYFDVDWDGIIIQVTPGCGWRYNFNGGKAETSGWEVDFTYAVNDEISLDFAGSSMTAETSIDISSLGASAGDRLPNTVETQWNLGLVYDTTIMSYPSYARLDVNYYGDSFNTFAENPNSSSPDYTKFNFNLGLDLSEYSKLQLSIDNLTDERTEAYIYAVDDTSWRPRNWMQWIPPRTVTLKYSYSF